MDTLLSVTRDGDARTIYSRQREGPDLEKSNLQLGEGKWLALGSSVREERQSGIIADVLATLSQGEQLSLDEIVKHSGAGRWAVRSALDTLIREGHMERSGTGKRGNAFRYEVISPDTAANSNFDN